VVHFSSWEKPQSSIQFLRKINYNKLVSRILTFCSIDKGNIEERKESEKNSLFGGWYERKLK